MSSDALFDNLKPGQWIFVTGRRPKPTPPPESPFHGETMMGFISFGPRSIEPEYEPDGRPVKIHTLQYPFLIITDHQNSCIGCIDYRRYTVQIADRKYVNAVLRLIEDVELRSRSRRDHSSMPTATHTQIASSEQLMDFLKRFGS